jgi:2'-phosphotransferase
MSKAATSKALCYILRHGAVNDDIPISDDGFILLSNLAPHKRLSSLSLQDYRDLVSNDSKNRYTLIQVSSSTSSSFLKDWKIRANQGHSIASITIPMHAITLDEYPYIIHGTFPKNIPAILESGLLKMSRNHIHFIPPGGGALVRGGASVCVYVDLNKAIGDGVVFSRSENGVVLTEGRDGVIDRKYFLKIVERESGKVLWSPA